MADLRSPLARARGLGSAKDGTHHWWLQRLTALAMIPLVVWFQASLVMLSGAEWEVVGGWMEAPWVMTFLILFIVVGLWHAQLGLQVVIEDYVANEGLRLAANILVKFIAFVAALGAVVSIFKVGIGG